MTGSEPVTLFPQRTTSSPDARRPPCATVVIDTYNQASYIDEAVTSVLTQEGLPGRLEIIVVDDGSTDATPERLIQYQGEVQIIRKENGGQASSFNVGVAQASSDVIMLLDGDDYWHSGKAIRVLDIFDKHPDASMVYHGLDSLPQGLLSPTSGGRTSCLSFRYSRIARILPVPSDLWFMADAYLIYLAPFCGQVISVGDRLAVCRLHGDNLYSFVRGSLDKEARKYAITKAVHRHVYEWLSANEVDPNGYSIGHQLRALELSIAELSFALHNPSRLRWMRHNAQRIAMERDQSRGYIAFRAMIVILGGVLGYRRTVRMQELYLNSRFLMAGRRLFAPSEMDRQVRAM